MNIPVLSIITFLPLACALLLIFIPKEQTKFLKSLVLAVLIVNFFISLFLFFNFDSGTADAQFVEKAEWIGYGINYHIGIDGISLFLILLTTFLMPIVVLSSWTYIQE